ncbi:hypothetical protein EYZ11_007064 [Aspergillus tanneri]|uniref:AMP-dependent synthetase/ligase domain-containing protein n=1 Tax=Aspergillus tanneri TaxID=1220188 RepID=A0A4S3JED2_9EURO|nr:uncharacterized protein ATNIH1004_003962 [Aspergillus tanneri]KAA8648079.1 hypothetical protein ATNIH1004_003962 [Aspergillus tanneri]THC93445.1 hypothetical protein EYZ11_007064 [Aspergillus tanneri]
MDGGPLENKTSVFAHIEQGLQNNPHGAAVVCMHQSADHLGHLVPADEEAEVGPHRADCLSWTYTQLHGAAHKLVAGMTANNVEAESTMLVLIPNGVEYALLLWACELLRLTFVSVDPALLQESSREYLKATLGAVAPSLVVVHDPLGSNAVDAALGQLPRLAKPLLRIALDSSLPGWISLVDLALNASTRTPSLPEQRLLEEAARNDNPDRIHSIMFTSGTSGRPKGCPQPVRGMTHVLHSQAWLINQENCSIRALQQAHNSRGIAPAQTLQTWREGGAVVLSSDGGFSVDDMATAISHYRVTFIVLTPAMVHGMAHRLSVSPFPVDCVQTVQIGGDAVTKDSLSRCAALFPMARICVNHGMTEGGGAFTWQPFLNTPLEQIPFFGETCPVGIVAPGAIVRIWDADRRQAVLRGQSGELHVCCGSVIPGYLHGVSASSFYEDTKGRWFNTGDIAMMNADGLVFILGRRKDMITCNGVAIMPAALESCVEKLTGQQASVVSAPHPTMGQEPVVVVRDFDGVLDREDIQRHVEQRFGRDYARGTILSLQEIGLDQFPVNATHKLVKHELEAAVRAHLRV